MAINVSSLSTYVDEQRVPLVARAVLGAKTVSKITKQTGVKSPTALNLVDTTIVFGDGSDCGWNEQGETKLTQRIITPAFLKVNMSFCDKKLLNKWASYEVQVAALPEDKRLPFEEQFTNDVVNNVCEAVEKMVWQGDTANGNEFDGFIKLMTADSTVITATEASGTPAYTAIKNAYLAMPEEIATKEDAVIFVSDGLFRQFIQELISANLYHYDANDNAGEYKLPGTNCTVVAVSGLNGTATYEYIIASRLSNLFYGTDLEGDEEKFDLWYSRDNREHRLAIEFDGGVQYAFGSEVVCNKLTK